MSIEHWLNDTDRGNWRTGRKTGKKVVVEEPVPLPLCPPQISPVLAWDQTRASKLTGWQPITSLMAQPPFLVTMMI